MPLREEKFISTVSLFVLTDIFFRNIDFKIINRLSMDYTGEGSKISPGQSNL